jgi:hypothetical protein
VTLSEISHYATDSTEQNLVKNSPSTALSHIHTISIHSNFSQYTEDLLKNNKNIESTIDKDIQSKLSNQLRSRHEALWSQLSLPSLPTNIWDLSKLNSIIIRVKMEKKPEINLVRRNAALSVVQTTAHHYC